MCKRCLITGATGQDGQLLSKVLLQEGCHVFGIKRRQVYPKTLNPDVHWIEADITDAKSVRELVKQSEPDEIYHLAAQSHVGWSFKIPEHTLAVNAHGTLNLLEATREYAPEAKFYNAATSEMFGGLPEYCPQDENTSFHPRSPYGIAKLAGYWMTRHYRETYNLRTCSGILFNHESSLRGDEFITKKICNYIKKDQFDQPLKVGNLLAIRDWGYAPEYVLGMIKILRQIEVKSCVSCSPLTDEAENYEDYVIGTGIGTTVKEFANQAFELKGINIQWTIGKTGYGEGRIANSCKTVIMSDEEYFRPLEVNKLIANPGKIENHLKWRPKLGIASIIRDMLK